MGRKAVDGGARVYGASELLRRGWLAAGARVRLFNFVLRYRIGEVYAGDGAVEADGAGGAVVRACGG